MKKLLLLLTILLIPTICYSQSTGGIPTPLWQDVYGIASGRPRTIIVSDDIIHFNGNIMSLDVTGKVISLDTTNFGTNLSTADYTVQRALDTIDDMAGGGGAPTTAHYLTTQAEAGLSAEFNLGALTSGLLKQTVAGAVSTPAIASEGTDYLAGTRIDDTKGNGDTTYVWSADKVFDQFALKSPLTSPTFTGAVNITDSITADSVRATSVLYIPIIAGNVSCDAVGKIALDSTNKQLGIHDGTQEIAIPLRHVMQGTFDFASIYDNGPTNHAVWLMDLDSTTYPNGIYITTVSLDCSAADPVTEFDGTLMYCDSPVTTPAIFPSIANQTNIFILDTTTGNIANGDVNLAIPSGKSIYTSISSDPTDTNQNWHLKINYRIPEN